MKNLEGLKKFKEWRSTTPMTLKQLSEFYFSNDILSDEEFIDWMNTVSVFDLINLLELGMLTHSLTEKGFREGYSEGYKDCLRENNEV